MSNAGRTLAGISITLTASILAWILWKPALGRRPLDRYLEWLGTRIEVPTHPDCKPRYRTWHAGIVTEGPWT